MIVHETAHQWFGDRVVLGDGADVWPNEGLATDAELLWLESQAESAATVAAAWYGRAQTRPTRPLVATHESRLFDLTAYQRGALALHTVRAAVGDDALRRWLRTYVACFAGQAVRTADLLALTRQDLDPVAETALRVWIESPTLPALPVLMPNAAPVPGPPR